MLKVAIKKDCRTFGCGSLFIIYLVYDSFYQCFEVTSISPF